MKYRILNQTEVLYDNLTENDYFDKIQELADQFYLNGVPNPNDLKTEIIEE